MQDLIEEQLGRILLAGAAIFALAVAILSGAGPATYEGEDEVPDPGAVQVELSVEPLAPKEDYFPTQDAEFYLGSARFVFVKPKIVRGYEAVELDVPPATVMKSPMLLPSPGPSLGGTAELPRWGEGLPPLELQPPEKKKAP